MLAWLRIWGAPTQPVLQAICREMITIRDQWNFRGISVENLVFCQDILGTTTVKIQYYRNLRPHGNLGPP